jgi:hypothetical protein
MANRPSSQPQAIAVKTRRNSQNVVMSPVIVESWMIAASRSSCHPIMSEAVLRFLIRPEAYTVKQMAA